MLVISGVAEAETRDKDMNELEEEYHDILTKEPVD